MLELMLGIFFIIVGTWVAMDPKGALDFKVKYAKMWGIKMIPSKRAYKLYRYFGFILLIVGILVFF